MLRSAQPSQFSTYPSQYIDTPGLAVLIRVCTVCMVLTSINRSYSQIPIWTTNHLYELKVLRNGSSWQCPLQTRLIVQTAEQTGWSSPLQKVGRKFAMIWYRRGAASCEILWLITIITPHHLSPRWISSLILTAIFLCEHSFHIFATPRTLTRSHHTAGEILQFALQTSASRALSSLGSSRSCFYIHKPDTFLYPVLLCMPLGISVFLQAT